jgi:hypothetical protein
MLPFKQATLDNLLATFSSEKTLGRIEYKALSGVSPRMRT